MRAPQGLGVKAKKYLILNTPNGRPDIVNVSINPITINDTAAVSTTANSYTQVKSYSNIGGKRNVYGKYMVNAIRIQVYGYVSAGTGYAQIAIDGSTSYTVLKANVGDPTGTSFTNTSSALIIDAIIALDPNSSHTVTINAYNSTSGNSTTISSVYGFQGYALTATSLTQIDSETVANAIIDEIGFSYNNAAGIHAMAYVNRSTSATATLQFADQFTPSGQYGVTLQIPAGNDPANAGYWAIVGDNNGNENVPQGYSGSWSWSAYGEVGASGDVLLIGFLFIWFAPNGLYPPTDLLASIGVIAIVPPGVTSGMDIGYQNLGTIISIFNYNNSNPSTGPGIANINAAETLAPITSQVYLNNGASGLKVLELLEVMATTI